MVSNRMVFGGLDSYVDIPKGYRRLQRRHGVSSLDGMSFNDVLTSLHTVYGIEWRDLFYKVDDDALLEGEGHRPVSHYRALVNPYWEDMPSDDIPGDREDAVWHIPTKKYSKVSHWAVWSPLFDALDELSIDEEVFGTCRLRREGGEVHMDLFFENAGIPDVDEDITLGISTGHDYYGNVRLYVDAIAYHDTGDGVGQVMRNLTDPRRRKHTGEAREDVVDWFEQAILRLDEVSDTLYTIVGHAMDYEVPLGDMPCSLTGFYEHLGLPNRGESTLADPAGERAVETAYGPYTSWHLYKAGMWAIEHEYEPRDTSSFRKHVDSVNLLLFNPSLAEKRVLSSLEETIESTKHKDDAEIFDYMSDDPDVTVDKLRTRATSISEGVDEYEEIRDRLTSLLEDDGVVERERERGPDETLTDFGDLMEESE